MRMLVKDHYQVRFDQNHGTAEFWADDATELAEQIFHHVKAQSPELAYSDFTVDVSLERLEGSVNSGQYAMFKIERLDP